MITLVLGGASSGKSEVAERLAGRDGTVTYVATGIPVDDDMAARIQRHRERRPEGWSLVEATGGDLPGALAGIHGPVLLDALGTWVASFDPFTAGATEALCASLSTRAGDTVVVSDEVGLGVHPSSELGRRFREDLGRLNQAIAGVADEVLLVIAGRVLRLEAVEH